MRFGVSRAHGGANLVAGVHRFAAALAEVTQTATKVSMHGDYESLVAAVASGGVDLAWMPPLTVTRALASGARLLVVSERGGALSYRSALVCARDRVGDGLDAKRVAWTNVSSAAGYVFPRRHLERLGVNVSGLMELFVGSPPAACAAVADGDVDLAACFVTDAAGLSPEHALEDVSKVYPPAAWRLRVVAVTDSIPPDGIVAAKQLARHHTLAIALSTLHENAAGAEALQTLMNAERLVMPSPALLHTLQHL